MSNLPSRPLPSRKRVNALELNMRQTSLHKNRELVLVVMQKSLKAVEAFHQPFGRRWNKRGVSRPAAADPILRPAKFARHLVGTPSAPQKNCVNLANQAQRHGKTCDATPLSCNSGNGGSRGGMKARTASPATELEM